MNAEQEDGSQSEEGGVKTTILISLLRGKGSGRSQGHSWKQSSRHK